jgi:hypothetical protein
MALRCVDTWVRERVWILWHYSHQKNLYCSEESKQFTKTSDQYKLFLKINVSCVQKCKVIWDILWMHQTKYFGLSVFFNNLCVFSPSLAWIIIKSLL